MASHRINLKGPWDYTWWATEDSGCEVFERTGSVSMPREWQSIFGDHSGQARFQRKFHRPTNLEPHERVMLILTEVRGQGSVQLNDIDLGEFTGTGQLVEFEITDSMKPFNELVIDIQYDPSQEPSQAGGLYGAVVLEIRWDAD